MRNTLILFVLSGSLLAGCTPFLEDLNANLKNGNANLQSANAGRRGTPGMPSTITAGVGAEVCDPVAFKAGFEDQYVTTWNQTVGNQESLYRLISQQHPENAAARHNYELYRGRRLSGNGMGHQGEYRVQFDTQGHLLNNCQSSSYMKGETAGIRAAGQDLQVLRNQELKVSLR